MTEDEAKTKMCGGPPAAAAAAYYRAGATVDAPMRCIGSACMAWRPAAPPTETLRDYCDQPTVGVAYIPGHRVYAGGWQYVHTDVDQDGREFDLLQRLPESNEPHGYCGLAGAPQ